MPRQERFLTSIDLNTVPSLNTDVLVIGSGVAGLSAALAAAASARVLLVTKDVPQESNSFYAQGGVAVALGADDTPELHLADTLKAGVGLCDNEAVRVLVTEGIDRCQALVDWGAPFDRVDGEIAFTAEGAHGRRRIIHAAGDATGKAVVETLLARAQEHPNIRILAEHFTVDLLHHEDACYGALLLDTTYGRMLGVRAGATIVATGGLGQVYRETTNPDGATGDGLALCLRAGAVLRDMEFVQFHPTTLYVAGAPRFLISESVRGEGAYILNQAGERFMGHYSTDKELAARDVVSQAIFQEIHRTGTTHVCLDLRHLGADLIERRFPTIKAICADYGLDITQEVVPVRPAVHYMMGGVKVDLQAATRVQRLYAVGEVASTGVHGANRLASNSLLEGLVFGWRAGKQAAIAGHVAPGFPTNAVERRLSGRAVPLDVDDLVRSLKSLTWRHIGVYRNGKALEEVERTIHYWERYVLPEQFQARRGFEVQNMLTVALVIAHAAQLRTESRGAHQRTDHPETDPAWERHIELDLDKLEAQ